MTSFVAIPFKPAMFAEQRRRVAAALRDALGSNAAGAVALLQGAGEVPRGSSDTCYPFRQESYFQYLFGHSAEGCYGALDVASGRGALFIPRLPEDYAVWMGALPTTAGVKATTGCDDVYYCDEMSAVLKDKLSAAKLLVLSGKNTDSGHSPKAAAFDGIDKFSVDSSGTLFDTMTKCRLYKTALEEELLAGLNKVASGGHVAVMQAAKPGLTQAALEAAFTGYVMANGQCKQLAYGGIAASGSDCAVLHYVDNDKPLLDGQLALCDFGGEFRGYASDITIGFPINGRFTPNQAAVYNAVLAAHDAVVAQLKAGVSWVDMHKLALRTIGQQLRKMGVIVKGTDEEIEAAELMVSFMPHGLGHLIGLEVHDVGGYSADAPPRPAAKLAARCRTARTMEERFFMTVEPGLYFNSVLLERAFKDAKLAPFLDEAKIRAEFWDLGGVRIESNLIILKDGVRNLTNVPRKVEDIEAVMAGKQWA